MKSWITISWLMAAMVLTLLFTNSCQHCNDPTDPDCGNYNPCYGVSNVADFMCAEYLDENTDLLVKSDTLIMENISWFNSKSNYLIYDWQIGSDTNHRHSKEFNIYFDKSFGTIPITLIGKRAPNPKCIPNDDGVDTFTKPITIVDWKASPLIGRYTGSLISNPSDTFTIEIKADHNFNQLLLNRPILLYLHKTCDIIYGIGSVGYKQFTTSNITYSPSGTCNKNPEIRGILDLSNQFITVTYTSSFDFNNQKNLTETFIGKRQP